MKPLTIEEREAYESSAYGSFSAGGGWCGQLGAGGCFWHKPGIHVVRINANDREACLHFGRCVRCVFVCDA
jgi:hypothetical protein